MPTDRVFSLCRILPSSTFNQLSSSMQQMAQAIGEQAFMVTEAVLPANERLREQLERFLVVVSSRFSGLILASSTVASSPTAPSQQVPLPTINLEQPLLYQVELTFDPEAITAFLQELGEAMQRHGTLIDELINASQHLHPNDPTLQSEFTLRLIEVLSAPPTITEPSLGSASAGSYPSCDQVVEIALRQQVDQERSLNQVTTQIRQSMDLPVILQTAVQQVQQLLQVDRVVIYQFDTPGSEATAARQLAPPEKRLKAGLGRITYEAIAADTLPSVLNLGEEAYCFTEVVDYRVKYRKGLILAVDDVEATYAFSPCLVRLLRRAKVRAKLVAPIVVQEELWGLLIAHQCSAPRHWQDSDQTFLQRIAEHLAIAIYQANLYAELQQQKQTLEQRVIERTQELHDALNAAQSANLAKTEFLSAMSHELRTPLTCIIGMTNTLLRLPPGPEKERLLPPQRQHDYLKTIQSSGEHLLQLINDILDLSEVEAGRAILDIHEFSLSQVAIESLRLLKDKADQNGVQLDLDLQIEALPADSSANPDRFTADPHRVQQVLLNLLNNAIKFTPTGGRVTLRVWQEQHTAVFQVEDSGIGIPESQRSLLFQKFQQLDMSHRRRYEGTGLGLALTKQLVELHRGWIEVESTVNVGSTFTVWLPAQPLDAAKSRPVTAASLRAPQGRIVLIENHEAMATLICDLLTTAGYQVVWMIDGSGVIPQVEILQPLAVILSSQLTGMGAYEILHGLRQNSRTQAIKILVLMVETTPEDGTHWLTSGADDYLSMSIDPPEQLLNKVAALCRSHDGFAL